MPRTPGRRARIAQISAVLALMLLSAASGIVRAQEEPEEPLPGVETPSLPAEPGVVIERIEVVGNHRLTADAFVFASGLKAGASYDPAEIKRAFKRLWEKDLFLNLSVEASDGDKGKVVTFHVQERPILVAVEYDNVRAITKSNIEDAFKQRGLDLSIGKPVNQKSLWKGSEYIKDLLASKGYLDSSVNFRADPVSESSQSVRFTIRQGPRTRIKKIEFVGNEIYSDRRLKRTLKQTRESSLYAHIGGKDLWRPALYDQDVQKIFELYKSRGYLDVEIKPPVVDVREPGKKVDEAKERAREEKAKLADQKRAEKEAKAAAKRKKRPPRPGAPPPTVKEPRIRRWVYLTVKVKEGPQYKTGTMTVKGNTVYTEKQVLARFPLLPGMVLNDSALQYGIERLRSDYGAKGYIYATATKSVVRREGNIADVTIEINEDKAYNVAQIEFEGNTVTRDTVLRREMRLNEGELLSRPVLDLSSFKIQQLGYVKLDPDPLIEPVEGSESARVRIKLEEQGRNQVEVGGGYSGLEGFFFTGSYSTRNFLGRGEILSAYAQLGGRRTLYQLSFQEPWFMGKPYQLGFSIYRQDTQFAQDQTQTGNGGSVVIGRQLGAFTKVQALYRFESVDFIDSGSNLQSTALSRSHTTIGSLTPSYSYDKVDDPFRPTRGRILTFSAQVAGRAFGGDNSFIKPLVQFTQYFPFIRKTFFGLHLEGGYVAPYGSASPQGGEIMDIPRFERFFVGGDLLGPRIFETRSISPVVFVARDGTAIAFKKKDILRTNGRDILGNPIYTFCDPRFDFDGTPGCGVDQHFTPGRDRIGGNRYFLTQFEYAIPVANPFILAFFLDAGNAFAEGESFNFDTLRVSGGLEARIYLPVFQAPIRFILGRPIKKQPGDNTNAFQFSIGTSF